MTREQLERAKEYFFALIKQREAGMRPVVEDIALVFDCIAEACDAIPSGKTDSDRRLLGIHLMRLVANRRNTEITEDRLLEKLTHTAQILLGKEPEEEEPPDEFDELAKADETLCPPG